MSGDCRGTLIIVLLLIVIMAFLLIHPQLQVVDEVTTSKATRHKYQTYVRKEKDPLWNPSRFGTHPLPMHKPPVKLSPYCKDVAEPPPSQQGFKGMLEDIPGVYKQDSRVCITTFNLMGGLGNSVGMLNGVLDFALRNDMTFLFPEMVPPRHGLKHTFSDLFGPWAVQKDNFRSKFEGIPIIHSICNASQPAPATKAIQDLYSDEFLQRWLPSSIHQFTVEMAKLCEPEVLIANTNASIELETGFSYLNPGGFLWPKNLSVKPKPQPSCRENTVCDVLVLFPWIRWHWNTERTGPLLKELYRKHAPDVPELQGDRRQSVSVATHVRLGDVKRGGGGTGLQKHTMVEFYLLVLGMITKVVKPECVEWHIITEDQDHPDVTTMKEYGRTLGIDAKFGVRDARQDFDFMAHADVLVTGGSSFGRLAGILGDKTVVDIEQPERPIVNSISIPGRVVASARPNFEGAQIAEELIQSFRIRLLKTKLDLAKSCLL